ncbi:MAG: nitrate- and nitrite sensing domain-containing protein [Pseudorhodoplanes sp.]|nr:nitrate- and nitrite sensing domain-containing protein [Pseudorhodoplanes sp.]
MSLRRFGQPAQRQALQAALSAAAGKEVARMRDAALKNAVGESTDSIGAANWFKTATARIDDLKKVEDAFAQDLRNAASVVSTSASTTLITMFIASMGLILIASGIAWVAAATPWTLAEASSEALAARSKWRTRRTAKSRPCPAPRSGSATSST